MQYIFIYRSAYYGLFDSFKVFASNSGSSSGKDVKFGAALVIGQVLVFCLFTILYSINLICPSDGRPRGRNDLLSAGHGSATANDAIGQGKT